MSEFQWYGRSDLRRLTATIAAVVISSIFYKIVATSFSVAYIINGGYSDSALLETFILFLTFPISLGASLLGYVDSQPWWFWYFAFSGLTFWGIFIYLVGLRLQYTFAPGEMFMQAVTSGTERVTAKFLSRVATVLAFTAIVYHLMDLTVVQAFETFLVFSWGILIIPVVLLSDFASFDGLTWLFIILLWGVKFWIHQLKFRFGVV